MALLRPLAPPGHPFGDGAAAAPCSRASAGARNPRPALVLLAPLASLCHNGRTSHEGGARPPPASSQRVALAAGWRVSNRNSRLQKSPRHRCRSRSERGSGWSRGRRPRSRPASTRPATGLGPVRPPRLEGRNSLRPRRRQGIAALHCRAPAGEGMIAEPHRNLAISSSIMARPQKPCLPTLLIGRLCERLSFVYKTVSAVERSV